jgi:hypothetical protein
VLRKDLPEYNNQQRDSLWADPVFQFCFMKRTFSVSPSDFDRFDFDRTDQNLYLHPSAPSDVRQQYFVIGNPHGSPWIQYVFDPHTPQHLSYRLDWLAGMWALSLRSYKHVEVGEADWERRQAELEPRIDAATTEFKRLADGRFHETPYAPRKRCNETTRVLIDPCQPGFLAILEVHREFSEYLRTT